MKNLPLIVGLGNYDFGGKSYSGTYHNVGSDVILLWSMQVLSDTRVIMKKNIKKNLWLVWIKKDQREDMGYEALFFINDTLMNVCGQSIKNVYQKYQCSTMIVIVDDLDTPLNRIRYQFKLSSGGHNGLRSIIEYNPEYTFHKILLGIGRPSNMPVDEYVLSETSESFRYHLQKNTIHSIYHQLNLIFTSENLKLVSK